MRQRCCRVLPFTIGEDWHDRRTQGTRRVFPFDVPIPCSHAMWAAGSLHRIPQSTGRRWASCGRRDWRQGCAGRDWRQGCIAATVFPASPDALAPLGVGLLPCRPLPSFLTRLESSTRHAKQHVTARCRALIGCPPSLSSCPPLVHVVVPALVHVVVSSTSRRQLSSRSESRSRFASRWPPKPSKLQAQNGHCSL